MVKNLPANAGDMCSICGLRRSLGEGNGNSLQHSCLGNAVDRGGGCYSPWDCKRVAHDLVTKQQQHQQLFFNLLNFDAVLLENRLIKVTTQSRIATLLFWLTISLSNLQWEWREEKQELEKSQRTDLMIHSSWGTIIWKGRSWHG